MYIVIGLPEYVPSTNLFYNSAVLLDPYGNIAGVYRKHSHLVESSWCASGTGKVNTFDTCYGKLAILICAEVYYPELSTQAFLDGIRFLVLPTNGEINTDLLKIRALEGDCHIILSNRFGDEKEEYPDLEKRDSFNEESFTIVPPFHYDFQGSKSCVINSQGKIELLENPWNFIGYCYLPLGNENRKKIVRRPELYTLLQHNTLDPYSQKCMNLPQPNAFLFGAARLTSNNIKNILLEIEEIFKEMTKGQLASRDIVKLIVFPANVSTIPSQNLKTTLDSLKNLAQKFNLDFVIGFTVVGGNRQSSESYLITTEYKSFCYKRTHKFFDENIETGNHYLVIDRNYGRIAIVQDKDLLVSETTKVLGKMGVDLVAVSGDEEDDLMRTICKVRSLDYLHILMANKRGSCGIYAGGFKTPIPFQEHDKFIIQKLDTNHVREKKELTVGMDPQLLFRKAG